MNLAYNKKYTSNADMEEIYELECAQEVTTVDQHCYVEEAEELSSSFIATLKSKIEEKLREIKRDTAQA